MSIDLLFTRERISFTVDFLWEECVPRDLLLYCLILWVGFSLGGGLLADQEGAFCRLQLLATIPQQQKVEVKVRPLEISYALSQDHLLVFPNRIVVKITYNLYKPMKIFLLPQTGEIGKKGKYTFDPVGHTGKQLPYQLRVHGSKRYVPSTGEVWGVYPTPQSPLIERGIGLDLVIASSSLSALQAGEYQSSLTVCIVEAQ